jgi:hypothetical protein
MSDLIKSIALSNISPSGQKDFVTPTGDQYVTAGPTREEIKARTPERGVMGAINDNVIEIANAAAGGVKSISDMVSPGNRVSKFIDENIIKAGEEAQSDQVKAEKMFLRQDLQNAQGAGDEISAYLGYIARNPGLALSQVAGSFAIPGIASAGAAGAATRGALAAGSSKEAARRLGAGFGLGAASATGGAMAGGDAAGGAYELVKRTPKAVLEQNPEYQELLQSMDPDAALEEIATRAARSASVAPGIVGAVLGPLGAERILAGAGRVGQSGSRTGNALKTGAVESGTEGFEEGLTEYSSRSAAAKYNPTIDPMKGVAGAATMGAVMGAGPGVVAGALQAPAAVPDLQPVIAKAAEPNSPLSRAALAALGQTGQAPAQSGSVDPATRLAELEMISSGTQELTVMGPDGQPVVVPADPGRFFTAEEKAEYDALRAAQAAAQTAAAPADPRGPAADDLVQRVRNLEEGMRNEGWLENLRRDNVQTRDVLADMALARDVNAPLMAREAALERVESATFFANRDAQPAAPMDSIQNYPEFAPTEPAPDLAAREVPSLAPVLGALRDPALRNQISDQDRQQLVYLYNLANNSQGENNVRVNAAQQAFEIIGRYQAPTATPSSQSVPALEQAAPATLDIAAPTSQQTVESQPQELDFLTTAPAPAKATGPLGGDTEQPAFLRKRANVVRQLVDNGFETVARDGSTFFLTNTKTGQKFQLDGPADAQLARKAIRDRVDALANTAAASPQNNLLEPTEAQIAAGNYKKSDVIDLNGMRIKIENPQGSTRRGTSPDGKQWETKMAHHYGEFQGTVGADGDKLDVFVGPRPDSSKVFVIDQLNKDGSFDEHKVMMGFTSEEAARQGYLANYEPGWTGLGAVTEMAVEDFKTWAKSRAAKKPAAESGVAPSATTVSAPATLEAAAAPDAAVDAAITQPNFTPAELAESEATAANQPQFRYINDEGKPRKLRVFRPEELPKQESPARPGAVRPLSQEEAGLIQAVAGLLNKQVVFFTPEGGGRISDGFVIPGQPNTIFIASETTVNPLAVFGHEFFHTLRETNPEAWNAIAAVVRTRVTDAKGFRADRYKDEVANKRGNAELSGEKGGELEELVSDLGGNLLNDPAFWREVFGQIKAENGAKAKGIIAKLAAQINRVIDRLIKGINQPGYRANRYVKDLEDVRAAFRTAMTQYLKDSGINERAMAAEQLKAEQQIKKSADRAPGVTVTGYHFSQQARPTLSTAYFGSGLRGSAREEILSSADGRLRQRLSFYFDKGTGVRPESGVGGIAHKATLTNIYDADIDPMKLKGGSARAFESKVLDAGYSGYLTRLEGTQPGQVILLGQQTITPEVLGPRSRIGGDETGVEAAPAPAPAPVKKGLMSRELNAINVDAIPGATLRAGMLTVPPDSVEQANAELERIGSPVRFSPDRVSDEELAQAEYAKIEAQYKGTEQWLKAPNGAPTNLSERQWVQVRTPSFKNWFGDWETFAGESGGVWNDDKGAVSKVVDENGEPLVVYHGSNKGGFMAFEEPGGEKRGDLGIFATSDEGMASSYVRRNRARRVEDPGADSDPQAGDQPGIYALFLNVRKPHEEHFEGANWDGRRYNQYQVVDENGEPIYTDDGRAYLEEDEARKLAKRNAGANVEPAPDHYQTTDSVVREARRFDNDGAVIRSVTDDGGGGGNYSGDPADVFVAFIPNQVKSADFNGGVFSRSSDDIRKSADRVGDVSLHNLVAERGERVVAARVVLSDAERKAIEKSAVNTGLDPEEIEATVRDAKAAHPASNGWAPVTFVRAELETDDSGKQKVAYVYENVPYSFNTDAEGRALKPGTPEYDEAVKRVAGGLVADVREVYERAKAGDKAASNIIAQAAWYKAMRERLRREFGGLGDLYADLLGATSPNTPVRGNWDNAIDSLRRALRGDFDELMPKWIAWADNVDQVEARFKEFFNAMLERGMSKRAIKELGEYQWLAERAKEARNFPDDMLPAKESGKKYGFNGQNVVRAMIDLWRVVKNADPDIGRGGTAPKALNFSGNLIGFRSRATIDVWAARNLQRNAGKPRIASMAETGVSGSMLTSGDATLQFGFGQDVFTQAVSWVRADLDMSESDVLAKINDDDLQALVWFVEKEIWTRNNWTSAAGEGGSFEFEADLAGIKDQARVRELRRISDSSVSATSAQKEVAQARIYEIAEEIEPYMDAADAMAGVVKATADVRKAKKSNDGSAKADRALAKAQAALEGRKAKVAVLLEKLPKSRRSTSQITARIGSLKKEAMRLAKAFDRPLPEQLRANRESALRELARMSRTLDRFVLGLSVQTSSEIQGENGVPTDAKQAAVAKELHSAAYKGDDGRSLMAAKVYSTEGRYGTPERAFDGEFIARDGFNPLPLAAKTFEVAQRERQDSAFVARVLRPDENVDLTLHRPGVEIYFRDSADADKAEQMMRRVARTAVPRAQPAGESRGERYFRVGGYTVVVDGRRTPQAISGEMPKAVGMRIMYLPEFNARYGDDSWNGLTDQQIVGKMNDSRLDLERLVRRVVDKLPEASFAGVFHYEVDARFNHEYKEAIDAYSDRDAARGPQAPGGRVWSGRSVREAVAAATAGDGAEREQSAAEVPGGEPAAGAAGPEVTKSTDRAPEAARSQPQERDEVTPAQAQGRRVTYEVEVEDTGDKAKLTVDAGAALSDYDERLTTMRKLLECLKK